MHPKDRSANARLFVGARHLIPVHGTYRSSSSRYTEEGKGISDNYRLGHCYCACYCAALDGQSNLQRAPKRMEEQVTLPIKTRDRAFERSNPLWSKHRLAPCCCKHIGASSPVCVNWRGRSVPLVLVRTAEPVFMTQCGKNSSPDLER